MLTTHVSGARRAIWIAAVSTVALGWPPESKGSGRGDNKGPARHHNTSQGSRSFSRDGRAELVRPMPLRATDLAKSKLVRPIPLRVTNLAKSRPSATPTAAGRQSTPAPGQRKPPAYKGLGVVVVGNHLELTMKGQVPRHSTERKHPLLRRVLPAVWQPQMGVPLRANGGDALAAQTRQAMAILKSSDQRSVREVSSVADTLRYVLDQRTKSAGWQNKISNNTVNKIQNLASALETRSSIETIIRDIGTTHQLTNSDTRENKFRELRAKEIAAIGDHGLREAAQFTGDPNRAGTDPSKAPVSTALLIRVKDAWGQAGVTVPDRYNGAIALPKPDPLSTAARKVLQSKQWQYSLFKDTSNSP